MSGALAGKICLVTGAAGGIGRAAALAFLAEGAKVIAADIAPSPDLPECDTQMVDVADAASVLRLLEHIRARCGRLDVLFHAAALTGGSGAFLDVSQHDFERYIAVNLAGSFLVGQAAARLMVKSGARGRIILVGSVNSFAAEPEAAPYVASKGGVRLLAKAMAVDLARYGITVNMIAPGAITVARNAGLFASPPVRQMHQQVIPLATPGLPEDIAAIAVFLAQDASRYVTGTEIIADGGLLAQIMPPAAREQTPT